MIIEKIKKEIEAGNLSEETINNIIELEKSVNTLKEEKLKLESKTNEIIESRDKIKQYNNLVKKVLEIEDGVEISEDLLTNKIKNKTTVEKNEIKNVEAQLLKIKEEYEKTLKTKENQLFQKDIDLEILKNGQQINCISPVALNVVMEELKKGAYIEDNKIVYKENNETIRKDGLPLTLSDKINQLKNDENYKGFFISEVQSGSGFKGKSTMGAGIKTGSVAERIRERAEAKNIKL